MTLNHKDIYYLLIDVSQSQWLHGWFNDSLMSRYDIGIFGDFSLPFPLAIHKIDNIALCCTFPHNGVLNRQKEGW